jgi:hypothetical protein
VSYIVVFVCDAVPLALYAHQLFRALRRFTQCHGPTATLRMHRNTMALQYIRTQPPSVIPKPLNGSGFIQRYRTNNVYTTARSLTRVPDSTSNIHFSFVTLNLHAYSLRKRFSATLFSAHHKCDSSSAHSECPLAIATCSGVRFCRSGSFSGSCLPSAA